jgi:hypothetical protein
MPKKTIASLLFTCTFLGAILSFGGCDGRGVASALHGEEEPEEESFFWVCCNTDDPDFCSCQWSEQNDCGGGEPTIPSCSLDVVGQSDVAECLTTESLFREGAYDCSCFGGHFTGVDDCGDPDALFTGMVASCTQAPDGPGTACTGGAGDCEWTNDGECDEGTLCDPGTDTADCNDSCEWTNDGECDEPTLCDPGTDTADCNDSCEWANDGECDEPTLCDPGTDSSDCG